jgi:hypothetical protein
MILTASGRAISIRFFCEYPKKSRKSSGLISDLSQSAVAKRRIGSVGWIDLSIVWKVINAMVPLSVAYHASIFGM